MKKFVIHLGLTLGILLVVAEMFFRWVIPAPEIPAAYFDPTYQIMRNDAEGPRTGQYTNGRLSEIRAPWRLNEHGWNSAFDFVPKAGRSKPLVAVVGDSYVENLYCAPESHLDYLIYEGLEQEMDVFGFGRRGGNFSNFVPMIDYVNQEFQPDVYVFVVNHRNLRESIMELGRKPNFMQVAWENQQWKTIPAKAYQPHPFKEMANSSAIVRYLRMNIPMELAWPHLPPLFPQEEMAETPKPEVDQTAACLHLIQEMQQRAGNTPILFVLHPNRPSIYDGDVPVVQTEELQIVKESLQSMNLPVVDLNSAFKQAYERDQKLFEFEVNQHWNEYANEVAAGEIVRFLKLETRRLAEQNVRMAP
ncbi:alginate O-acetyltransferase AlgX-related protein [Pontibacter sp. G13]|uniref:alginate O-acetyltransferase AlgX-related protein n=1 Tax=Pontibacter sp. G13 TaxID=3074898 RepID=UPI00288C6026|nr:hypothetical protein [Pontibacter sp. G13]WNJ19762.1 hypothetical protein RJD25_04705 [Pontibacter sp. G13]